MSSLTKDEEARLSVWMEMRSEIAMREAAMVALYAGASEDQFVELARGTFRSHRQKRDQRLAEKLGGPRGPQCLPGKYPSDSPK
jgi:hypothetical protein